MDAAEAAQAHAADEIRHTASASAGSVGSANHTDCRDFTT
jgi:hypothetical protein